MTTRILVVEDEVKIAEILADYLRDAAMDVSLVHRGDEALAAFRQYQPHLVILDLMLPGTDGLTLCRQFRAESTTPILMLSAKIDEIDRLLGLELGADDYVCKPFSPREVVARAKAILRRAENAVSEDHSEAALVLDEARMQASFRGVRLSLTPVEFNLLMTLSRHHGRVYRRDELLDQIYDDFRDVSDRTIDSHIKNLRRKLAVIAPQEHLIESVYGIGYRLNTEI